MKAYTLEVTDDQVDSIIRLELAEATKVLKADLKARKSGTGYAIFSEDKDEDIKQITAHLTAMKLVIAYYSVSK